MKVRFFIICVFLLIGFIAKSQNLINNSCFDDYYNYVDSNKNLVYHPKYWYYSDSILNHPIYFSTDRFKDKSFAWNLHPDSALINKGQKANYISILILPNTQRAYTALKEQLVKGKKYHLRIDIKAFDQSNYFSDLLVGFKDCIDCSMDSSLYQLRLIIPDSSCNESLYSKWLTLDIDFYAKGNEKVLVITSGSVKDYMQIINSDKEKFLIRKYQGNPKLKYYIDNVCLNGFNSNNDTIIITKIDSLKVGESIILHNIYFDFDKYDILNQSFPELNMVCDYLDKNKNVTIMITGHTDNYGTDEYNDTLSYRRATSVVNYLVDNGIMRDRFQAKGFGARFPIASNNNSEGRQMNRRIELKIIKK